MPAPLDVDWSAVKALCVAVGMAEAARRLGIEHDAIRQRCFREKWKADPDIKAALEQGASNYQPMTQPVSQPVTDPAKALASAMAEDNVFNRATVLAIARKKLAGLLQKDIDELLLPEMITAAHQTTKDAALGGSWQANQAIPKINLHVTGAAHNAVTVDAEWREVGEEVSLNVSDY